VLLTPCTAWRVRTPQTQFVSEAVAALCEAPLKTADVPAALAMAAALHSRYADFAATLGPALAKAAAGGGGSGSKGGAGACVVGVLAARSLRGWWVVHVCACVPCAC
jgi:hypothetical protein